MASHGASGVGADWSDVAGALDASQSQATASDGPTGRIWCVSDVHTDHADNMRWCEGLAHGRRFENDALILAGDVTASNELLERTLRTLVGAFAVVYYTPGNHDLWVKGRGAGNRPGQPPALDSIARAQEVFALCASLGVRTTPSYACGAIIAPILAWYHASFDTEPDVTGWEGIPSHKIVMNDFHLCQWPAGLSTEDDSIARRFDAMNDARGVELTTTVAALREAHPDAPLISFSHFVPRLELQPEKRYLYFPGLAKACGSTFLQERVAQLGPAMHVFGHTHFGLAQPSSAVASTFLPSRSASHPLAP